MLTRQDGPPSLSYIDRHEYLSMGAQRGKLSGVCAHAAIDASTLTSESITGPSCRAVLKIDHRPRCGGDKDVGMFPVRVAAGVLEVLVHVREPGADSVTKDIGASATYSHAPNAYESADTCEIIEFKLQGPRLVNTLLDPRIMLPRKHLGPEPAARTPPKVSFFA